MSSGSFAFPLSRHRETGAHIVGAGVGLSFSLSHSVGEGRGVGHAVPQARPPSSMQPALPALRAGLSPPSGSLPMTGGRRRQGRSPGNSRPGENRLISKPLQSPPATTESHETMTTQMRGVYSIPVTPFNEDGSVDYTSLQRCVAFCVEAGAHGIVFPVNVSEGPYLTDEERTGVIRAGVKAVAGAVPFVAGVTGLSTAHAVAYTRAAVEAGADSIIAAPPNGADGGYIYDYFAAIAEAAGVPVWLQNNKPPTSPTIPTPLIVRMLKEIEHVEYVKEESVIPGQVMTEITKNAGTACKGLMGGMGGRFLVDEYRRGACGTMPSGHITDAHRRLWDALEKGGKDSKGMQVVTDEAREIWEQMLPALNFEFLYSIGAYKAAFWRRGIIKSPVSRNPSAKALDRLDMEEWDRILDRLSPLFNGGKVKVG